MKKILTIIIFTSISLISFAKAETESQCTSDGGSRICDNQPNLAGKSCRCEKSQEESSTNWNTSTTQPQESTSSPVNGITINEKCLLNGQCKYNIYETLGIRKSVWQDTSVGLFVQDIVLSATFFIGTVVTIALIVSWLMYIFAGATGKDPSNAKKGITWSLIGLLIVSSSYLIIRLVQYIAKGM